VFTYTVFVYSKGRKPLVLTCKTNKTAVLCRQEINFLDLVPPIVSFIKKTSCESY